MVLGETCLVILLISIDATAALLRHAFVSTQKIALTAETAFHR